ncbi:MAG: hypothetical protein KME43_09335 [Myxacorys chilensis ATA2-1-KO14]|jgi:hypothetical protein|nr:hypothetical protein [Myxacorys chilensis ATA2-1-KO14]
MEQQELRRAAAKAFMESLDKLQETLSESEAKTKAQPTAAPAMPVQLEEFEQAVADIEQFMQSKGESA